MARKFSTKDPVEIVLVTFDFTPLFVTDIETIQSTTWSSTVVVGTDPAASTMIGTPSNDANSTSCLISFGVSSNEYLISAVVTTSMGQKLKLSGIMPVQTQG